VIHADVKSLSKQKLRTFSHPQFSVENSVNHQSRIGKKLKKFTDVRQKVIFFSVLPFHIHNFKISEEK